MLISFPNEMEFEKKPYKWKGKHLRSHILLGVPIEDKMEYTTNQSYQVVNMKLEGGSAFLLEYDEALTKEVKFES